MLFGIYQCMHKKKSAEGYTDVGGLYGQPEVQSDQFLSELWLIVLIVESLVCPLALKILQTLTWVFKKLYNWTVGMAGGLTCLIRLHWGLGHQDPEPMKREIRSPWYVFVIRMPRDLPCFGRQQTSIKTCIVWPWLVLVLTATFSVCTSCPNTLVSTRRFLKRWNSQ